MPRPRAFRELRLPNGATGDPCLFVDDQGPDNALLIETIKSDDQIPTSTDETIHRPRLKSDLEIHLR